MAIVRTARGTAGDSLPLVSSTFTPNEGDVVVAICVGFDAPAADEPNLRWTPSDTFGDSGGGSWQSMSVVSTNDTDFWQRTTIFYRVIGSGASAGTISCNRSTGSFSFNSAQFHQLSGVDTSAPVRQWNSNAVSNQAVSSISVSLASAPLADSLVVTTVHTLFGAADPTNPSGYTTVGSPFGDALVCEVAEAVGASASQSVTWGVASDACAATMIVEFAAAGDDEPGEPEPVDVDLAPAVLVLEAGPLSISGGEPIPGTVDYVIGLHGEGGGDFEPGGFGSGCNYPASTGGEVPFVTIRTQGPIAMQEGGYAWADHSQPGDEYDWQAIKAILDAAVPADARRVALHGFSAGGAVAILALQKGWQPPRGTFVGVVLDDPALMGDTDSLPIVNNSGVKVAMWATFNGSEWNINAYYGYDLLAEYETALGVTRQQNPHYTSHAPMTRSWDDQGPYAPPELLDADWWDVDAPEPVAVDLAPAELVLDAGPLTVAPGAVVVESAPADLALDAGPLAVAPGGVSRALSSPVLALEAGPLTIAPGAVSVALTSLTASLAAGVLDVEPGPVAVVLGSVDLAVEPGALDVTPGGAVVVLGRASLVLDPQPLSIEGVAFVVLRAAPLALDAGALSVTPGGVSRALSSPVLALAAGPLAIAPGEATVALTSLTASLAAGALSVTPGEAVVALAVARVDLLAVPLGVLGARFVTLAPARLDVAPGVLMVEPGPVAVDMARAGLVLDARPLAVEARTTLVLGRASLVLDARPLALTTGPTSIDLAPARVLLAAGALSVVIVIPTVLAVRTKARRPDSTTSSRIPDRTTSARRESTR